MSKKSPLLIYNQEGDVQTCFECPKDKKRPVDYVVHYNMSSADKDDKKDFKGALSKGIERFLCRNCFIINWRDNPMRNPLGQSDFTFVTIMDWKKLSYQYK